MPMTDKELRDLADLMSRPLDEDYILARRKVSEFRSMGLVVTDNVDTLPVYESRSDFERRMADTLSVKERLALWDDELRIMDRHWSDDLRWRYHKFGL